ncbi:hypothetical protein RIF29_27515 [Crotalaria pallida]|uniref:BZIP domain-containing protein n=1 Tax=Crotalaria pallida TaxID=3830 RepID=A0AAN9EU28_CROPI
MVINSEAKGKAIAYDNVSQQFANASSTMNLQQPQQQTVVPMQDPAEPAFPPLSRQTSILSLTLDELQCKSGKSFGSMNMDEFINSILNTEEFAGDHPQPQPNQDEVGGGSSSKIVVTEQQPTNIIAPQQQQQQQQQQGTLYVPPPICNKTVDEVWAEIHQVQQPLQVGANDNNLVMNSGRLRREKALRDLTLEDFLVKAGVVQESPLRFKPSPSHQPATMPTTVQNQAGINFAGNVHQIGNNFASNVNQTGNFIASNVYQIGNNFASNVNQTGNSFASHVNQAGNFGSYVNQTGNSFASNVNMNMPFDGSYGMRPAMGVGYYAEQNVGNPHGIGSYPMLSQNNSSFVMRDANASRGAVTFQRLPESSGGSSSGRRRMTAVSLEQAMERRQRRMLKNRESAARSRLRKQVYTSELEAVLNALREENAILKQLLAEAESNRMEERRYPTQDQKRDEKMRAIRRTVSAAW